MDSNKLDKNKNNEHLPIDESLRLAHELFDKMIRNNDMEMMANNSELLLDNSMYHHLFNAMGLTYLAFIYLEKDYIEKATKAVSDSSKFCNKYRRGGLVNNIMKLIKTPKYEKYTDIEVHAELVQLSNIGLSAIVGAMETHNIYGLIKVVYRLQKCLKVLKGCILILKMKTDWESEQSKKSFKSAVKLAIGLSHFTVSHFPPKLLKVVNFFGIGGSETVAFDQINKAAFQLPGIGSQVARIFLLLYWTYIQTSGGLGADHLDDCKQVLDEELKRYPNNAVLIGFKAKIAQISGRIDTAIDIYTDLLNSGKTNSHKLILYELILSYSLKCDWNNCIKYSLILRHLTTHSPAMSTYAEAVILYVTSLDNCDDDLKQKASELFEIVPSLRIRHVGKTITPEKNAVINSEKYFKNGEFLILPELEILYGLNYLSFLKGDQILLNRFMDRVDKQINKYKDDIKSSDYLDNYLTALFYKGVIHKLLGNFSEAKQCFNVVIEDESRIGREYSIPPQAVLELGLTELAQNNYEESKKWLNKCIDDYSGYSNENYVHLRAFAGLRLMGINNEKEEADETKREEYKKQWLKDIKVTQKQFETLVESEENILSNK